MVQLKDIVDGFGIGTAVAYPPSIDFGAKIVEVHEEQMVTTSGPREAGWVDERRSSGPKASGTRRPGRCGSAEWFHRVCSSRSSRNGKIVSGFTSVDAIRRQVVKQIKSVKSPNPPLVGIMKGSKALVVVDLQNDFCPRRSPASKGRRQDSRPDQQLGRRLRRGGLPIAFTRDWHPRTTAPSRPEGGCGPRIVCRARRGLSSIRLSGYLSMPS